MVLIILRKFGPRPCPEFDPKAGKLTIEEDCSGDASYMDGIQQVPGYQSDRI